MSDNYTQYYGQPFSRQTSLSSYPTIADNNYESTSPSSHASNYSVFIIVIVLSISVFFLFNFYSSRFIKEVSFPEKWKMYEVPAFEALKIPIFRETYKKAISQVPENIWNENKSWLTLTKFVSSNNRYLSTNYGQFILMEGCKQHNCLTSYLKIIYDPIKDKVAILIFVKNQGAFIVGDKSTNMHLILKELQKNS